MGHWRVEGYGYKYYYDKEDFEERSNMKLSENLRFAIVEGQDYISEDSWKNVCTKIEQLEADSELLSGLIEMLQYLPINLVNYESHAENYQWEVQQIDEVVSVEEITHGATPRAALEAAVAKFREKKK